MFNNFSVMFYLSTFQSQKYRIHELGANFIYIKYNSLLKMYFMTILALNLIAS